MTNGTSTTPPTATTTTTSQGPVRPASSRGRHQWVFHVVALVVCAAATFAAGFAAVIVSFGTSTCNDLDTSDELRDLRLGLAVVGLLWTAVPAVLAGVAAKLRFAWGPWALLVGVPAAMTVYAIGTVEVSTWCF